MVDDAGVRAHCCQASLRAQGGSLDLAVRFAVVLFAVPFDKFGDSDRVVCLPLLLRLCTRAGDARKVGGGLQRHKRDVLLDRR